LEVAILNCPGWKELAYWLYFKKKEGGWFTEMQQSVKGLQIPMDGFVTSSDKTIDSLVPQKLRIPIK
jgi:hypothetical protein